MENNNTEIGKNSLIIKLAIISLLIFALIIPTLFIKDLIKEREKTQKEATAEVSMKWGEPQTITGPILSIPYIEFVENDNTNDKNKIVRKTKYLHILPDELNIMGTISPEKRYRGIYEIIVYCTTLQINGQFNTIDLTKYDIDPENLLLDKALMSIGISDLKGVDSIIYIRINEEVLQVNPGMANNDIVNSGVNVQIKLDSLIIDKFHFNTNIKLKGSDKLYFTPVGKNTNVHMQSNWNDPGFDGAFLPDVREITDNGFNSEWNILNVNRSYPQSWKGKKFDLSDSTFGVKLLLPVDHYLKSLRSVKYAILIIVLTFISFFLIELIFKIYISAFNYGLIGLALVLFYILLISISEHSKFNIAYLISSGMIISMITIYSITILKKLKSIIIVSFILSLFYGFIYILLQQQDYALIMGSLGLFLILALVMYFTRKIDWKKLNHK